MKTPATPIAIDYLGGITAGEEHLLLVALVAAGLVILGLLTCLLVLALEFWPGRSRHPQRGAPARGNPGRLWLVWAPSGDRARRDEQEVPRR